MRLGRRWWPSVLSGVLAALSYPGYDVGPLAWVALLPLLLTLQNQPRRAQFWSGWRAGFIFFLVVLPWLLTLLEWGGTFIIVGYVALSAALGILWGLWAVGCARLARLNSAWLLVFAPSLWIVLDYVRSSTVLGFPWGMLGHALYRSTTLVQLAAWTGVWGLSFLIVFVNAALLLSWRRRTPTFVVLAALVLALTWVGGHAYRLQIEREIERAPMLRVALVQPNIPQRLKNDPAQIEALRQRYQALFTRITDPVDVVVLPESILPTLVLDDVKTVAMLTDVARRQRSSVLFGAFTRESSRVFNSAVLFNPDGQAVGQYDKVQLVPFSTEYFPLKARLQQTEILRWLGTMPLGLLTRGAGFLPLRLGRATFGTPICFESAFGRVSRAFVANGANVLVTITNDAWFKNSVELRQHFAMGVLRAVETGRAFLQVANTGISGLILPSGAVALQIEPGQARVATVSAPLLQARTPYVVWGDWLVGLALLLSGVGGAVSLLPLRCSRKNTFFDSRQRAKSLSCNKDNDRVRDMSRRRAQDASSARDGL